VSSAAVVMGGSFDPRPMRVSEMSVDLTFSLSYVPRWDLVLANARAIIAMRIMPTSRRDQPPRCHRLGRCRPQSISCRTSGRREGRRAVRVVLLRCWRGVWPSIHLLLPLRQPGLAQVLDNPRVLALKLRVVGPLDVGPILHREAGHQLVETVDCRLGFRLTAEPAVRLAYNSALSVSGIDGAAFVSASVLRAAGAFSREGPSALKIAFLRTGPSERTPRSASASHY
jgi:hypothetical protein